MVTVHLFVCSEYDEKTSDETCEAIRGAQDYFIILICGVSLRKNMYADTSAALT